MAGAEFSGGRGLITAADGAVRFDTDGELFHITDKAINGSISIPARQCPKSGTKSTKIAIEHLVGTCNASATHIVGMFLVSGQGSGGVPYNIFFDASGTYLHLFSAIAGGNLGGNNTSLQMFAAYTFYCSAGNVYMRDRAQLPPVGNATVVILPHTITFRLKAGLFT